MDFLIEPLRYGFMLRGLIGGILAAIACATLSTFVVWRGMSFMGDALAHSVLPGIVVAYSLGISLFWGALGAAMLVVIGIGLISGQGRLSEDTAIGVVFAGFFALGIVLIGKVTSFVDLSHILFGNILGISQENLLLMGVVASVVVLVVALAHKEIVVTSFDPSHSTAIGLSIQLVRYLVLILLALTTVVAIQTIGVVMVLALLVTPGAAASLLSRRLSCIVALAPPIAIIATLVGFYTSYYADVPSGPAIVLALTAEFMLCGILAWLRRVFHRKTSKNI